MNHSWIPTLINLGITPHTSNKYWRK